MLISQHPNQSTQKEQFDIKILLVEDDLDFGAAIRRALKQHNYLVNWVTNGAEAWTLLENHQNQYTLAIFDWMLPGVTGLELCKRLRDTNNPLPVLMLTTKDRIEDKIIGLDVGADDYLFKSCTMTELVARLQALQRRYGLFQQPQKTVSNLTLNYNNNTVISHDCAFERQEIPLTNKEFYVLEYLMSYPNQIITGDEIRAQLQKMNSESCSCVVATQVRALRQKLINCGCSNPIETLQGSRYRFIAKELL
ncbi:two-component response regulator [Calothrix sp. PCC 7716]|nr:two-component response regulator [Calothrix sp. PCC 7716]